MVKIITIRYNKNTNFMAAEKMGVNDEMMLVIRTDGKIDIVSLKSTPEEIADSRSTV